MKNIILFLILLCATISYGQGVQGVFIKDRDSIAYNGFTTSDLFGVQRPGGGTYSWYRTSWYGLAFGVRNVMLGQTNTWTGMNTFNSYTYVYRVLPTGTNGYIGTGGVPFKYIYGNNIIVVNPLDTAEFQEITYDGNGLSLVGDSSNTTFGSIANPFRSVYTDSVISNGRLHLSAPYGAEVTGIFQYNAQLNVPVTDDDSSLIVTSNFIEVSPTDTVQVDTLYIDPNLSQYSSGIEITIYNKSTTPITFKDAGGAGFENCMRLTTDIVLNQYDSFKLIYYLGLLQWLQSGAFIDNN